MLKLITERLKGEKLRFGSRGTEGINKLFDFTSRLIEWRNQRQGARIAYLERIEEARNKKAEAEIKHIEARARVIEEQAKTIRAKLG